MAYAQQKDGTMDKQKVTEYKNYIGDCNLENGGTFFDLSDAKYGYVSFLEVIDIDSACGMTDCVLVQFGSVGIDDDKINSDALRCMGQTLDDLDPSNRDLQLAYANISWGLTRDLDDYVKSLLLWSPFDITDEECPDLNSWNAKVVKLDDDDDVFSYLLRDGFLSEFE